MATKYLDIGDIRNQEFDDMTTCCICTDVYTNPKALPCIHTFCMKCIQETGLKTKKGPGDEMPCPICRRMFMIPTGGFNGLPKNFFIERLLQMANVSGQSASSRAVCDACAEESEEEGREIRTADMFCVDCKQKYCEECSRHHRKFKLTKNHKLVQINEHDCGQNLTTYQAQNVCELHEQKVLDIYCVDCKTVVCAICFIDGHSNHKGSHVDKFVDGFRKQIESNVQAVNECRSKAQIKQAEFMKVKEDIREKVIKLECDVANRKDELKQLLDKHEASLLQGLCSIRQSKLKEIQMATGDIDSYLSCSETYNSYCQKIMAEGSASDICRAFSNLSVRAMELQQQWQPMIEREIQSINVRFRKSEFDEFLKENCDNLIGEIEGDVVSKKTKRSRQSEFAEQAPPVPPRRSTKTTEYNEHSEETAPRMPLTRSTSSTELNKHSKETAPLLARRRSTGSAEHNKHSKETDELQTACFLLKDHEIKFSDLHLESLHRYSLLDTEIWKGKWKKTTDVCVRKLIGSKRSTTEFFVEAQILHRLKHPNIVQLIGISSLAQPLLIVTEYLSLGSLRNHLRKDRGNTVDLPIIIDFARQIAEGMCFVAREDIVHRDLKSANILLASTQLVKISNFNIAVDLQGQKSLELSRDAKFPNRWSPPEVMVFGICSSASDVWSFGILLYEMFTFGEMPYSGKTHIEVFELLQADYRLPCPKSGKALSCPDTVYLMMVWCWDKDPDARPSFQMLQKFFQEYFQVSDLDIVQDTIVSRPLLLTIIKGCTAVRGMALLDGWLYVVRFGSTQVEVYEARDEFKRSKKSISITSPGQREKFGLFHRLKSSPKKEHVSSGIEDIASCNRNKRLYLSDWQNTCVHCIDPVRKEVTRSWGVESGEPLGISVNSEGNVVVSCGDSAKLCEYSAEGLLLRTIELEMTDQGPWHGLQLLGVDRWVVCHGGRYVDDGYVCVVDSEGNYVRSYKEIHLKGPSHLAVLSSNHVLVAESTRNRIILLHPSLCGPVREILNPDHGVMMPVRIHLCESSGRLVVGLADGTVLVYQIMKAADERSAALSN